MNPSYILLLCTLCYSTLSLRIPQSRRLPNTRDRQTPNTNRHHGRSPRLFDEFLLTVVQTGTIPTLDENAFLMNPNNTQAESTPAPTHRNPVHTSLRNYIRHNRNRDITPELENLLRETGSGRDPDNEGEADPLSSLSSNHRANVAGNRNLEEYLNNDDILEEWNLSGVSRDHWSCCALGRLAGDKGFLCDPQFYASRIQLQRAPNRVHHRRLTGTYFRDGSPTQNGGQLLDQFYECVQDRHDASQFETCCDATFADFQAREDRWRAFRRTVEQTD